MSKPYLKISKSYNLTNIEKMWKDYEALFCADGEKFKKEYKEVCDKALELYSEKIDEYNKNLKLTTEVKQKISEIDYKNQNVDTKIKQEKLLLETDKNHLESIKNECMSFKTEENHLKGLLIESKKKLNQVIEEKKVTIKKLKKEIKAFKYGIDLYESVLCLSMDIESKDKHDVIYITMKHLNSQKSYTVIFEEHGAECFELIDIKPSCQLTAEAVELYRGNKDVQGLLTFLWDG